MSELWTLVANNILQFEISKIVVAAIWKIEKPQYFPYVWTSFDKFGMVMCLDPPDLVSI